METFVCKTSVCGKVETYRGAFCSCFNFCRTCHKNNGGTCPVYLKPTKQSDIPICKRNGCVRYVCKNSKGQTMKHCGLTCFRMDSSK